MKIKYISLIFVFLLSANLIVSVQLYEIQQCSAPNKNIVVYNCFELENSAKVIPGTVIDNKIYFQGENGNLIVYDIKSKHVAELQKDIVIFYSLINTGDSLLVINSIKKGIIYFYNVKKDYVIKIGLYNDIFPANIDIKDSILLISGSLRLPEKQLSNYLLHRFYSYSTFYFGADTTRWGTPLSEGGLVERRKKEGVKYFYNYNNEAFFTDDRRILLLDSWDGYFREFSLDGRLLFEYPRLKINYCESLLSVDRISYMYDSCSCYFSRPSYLRKENLFLAYRNLSRPPVVCDIWDISKRRFVDSITIGKKVPFSCTDSSVWLIDSVTDKYIFLGEYKVDYQRKDELENLAEISITEPISLSKENLTIYLDSTDEDTIFIINSHPKDCLAITLENNLKERYTTRRIITAPDRKQIIFMKNSSKFAESSGDNKIYNIDMNILNYPYMMIADKSGKIIKKFNRKEAMEFLKSLEE